MLSKEEFDNLAQSSKVKCLKGHKKGEVQKKNCQYEVIEQFPHNILKLMGDCIYLSKRFRPDLDQSKCCLDPV